MDKVKYQITKHKKIFKFESDALFFEIFGSIYNEKEVCDNLINSRGKSDLLALIHNISGYFFLYVRNQEGEYYFNDIFGNFRLYEISEGTEKILFDEFNTYSKYRKKLSINNVEEQYLKIHKYTTGQGTIFNEVSKMIPASFWSLENDVLEQSIYFSTDKAYVGVDGDYESLNYELIKKNIQSGLDPNLPTVLFFSGGVDSTYLYFVLKELNIDFRLIFIRYSVFEKDNRVDLVKVQKIASLLGEECEILDFDIENEFDKYDQLSFSSHPFDMAFPSMYFAQDAIVKKYGRCNIINGQTSDSIYCWGNSSKSISAMIQRFLASDRYMGSPYMFRKVIAKTLSFVYKIHWRKKDSFYIPFNWNDYLVGLLSPQGYVPIIRSCTNYREYNDYLSDIVDHVTVNLSRPEAILYMKFMYLQGTSNIMVIESANKFDHNLIMPFLDARIVYLRMLSQSNTKDLIFPRYVLEQVMKYRFDFDPKIIASAKKVKIEHCPSEKCLSVVIANMYALWLKRLGNLVD